MLLRHRSQDGGINLFGPFKNRPTALIDLIGLDIWVENTTTVSGWHKRICVDVWEIMPGPIIYTGFAVETERHM